MKQLLELTGGYERHMSYLLKLQSEVNSLQNSVLKNIGHDLVLDGCAVTTNPDSTINIAPGVVYVAGEIVRFEGINNVLANGTKAFIKGSPVLSELRTFNDNSIKNTYTETFAVIGDVVSPQTQIVVKPVLYTIESYIQDVIAAYAIKGEIKDIYDLDGTFLTNFNISGLGITPRYSGWALFNGNNGAPDGRGRTRITAGYFAKPGEFRTFAHGEIGGSTTHILTIDEMPEHDHDYHRSQFGISAELIDWARVDDSEGGGFDLWAHNKKTNKTGLNYGHNNMQPFIAVYTIIKIV